MQFNQHFTYPRILKAVISPIIMVMFNSLYSVVDGLFLSNFAGKEAFAAVGFISPFLMMFNSTGFMFGTGGSALIAKLLGEKKEKDANEVFSTILIGSVLTGIVMAVAAQFVLKPIALIQGAEGQLLENSLQYGRIFILGIPLCIVQFEFQALYATSGKGKLGLYSSIISGVMNIVLDTVFLYVFKWGIQGAAIATVISQWVGGLIPFIYYGRKNTSMLQLVKSKFRGRDLIKSCGNGSSEMVNNISISLVSFFYNIQLISYAGSNGIAAYGIMSYVSFFFTSIFWGYISGIAPIISYNYGDQNHSEMKNLLKKSLILISFSSIIMFILSEILGSKITHLYAGSDRELLAICNHGFKIFSFNFMFAGLSIFLSSFFTALNNGLISAILSLSRVFLFQIPGILLLPKLLKLDGIWISIPAAELLTVTLGIIFLIAKKKKYNY